MLASRAAANQKIALLCVASLFVLAAFLLWVARWPEPGTALAGHDIRGQFYPWLTTFREAIHSGSLPAWDRYQFAGYPFLANAQVAVAYPLTWLALLLPVNVALSWMAGFHIWLAGVGMLFYIRSMRGTWFGAMLGAVTYALSGFFVARIWAGHIGMVATNAWLPVILLATVWATRRGDLWSGLLAGLPFGLALLAGHTTSALYLGVIWLVFAVYLAFDTGKWLLVGRQVVLSAVAGLGLAAVSLLPLLELTGLSTRALDASVDFALTYSMPVRQLLALLAPGLVGEPVQVGYWGAPTFEEMTYYAGILPFVAFLVAVRKPNRLIGFYVVLAVAGLLLAVGSNAPFYEPLARWFAPLRLLRTPSRAAFLFVFAAAGLLAEVVSWLGRSDEAERRALLRRWLWFCLSLVVVAGVVAVGYLHTRVPDPDGRLPWQIRATQSAVLLAVAGCGLLLAYVWARPRARSWSLLLAGALVVVVAVDLLRFGLPLVRVGPVGPTPLWTDARALITTENGRVLPWGVPIFDQNGAGEVELRSIFGYNPLEVDRLIKLAASQPDPRSAAYDVLAISEVIAPGVQGQYFEGDRPLTLQGETADVAVHGRARVLPLARMVHEAEIIPDSSAALSRIHQPDFDPATTAIVASEPACELPEVPAEPGVATLVEQSDGYYRVSTRSQTAALLILSETAYPGWEVRIAGETAEPLLAYTALQAVCVPAGEHEVVWRYVPHTFYRGGAITLLFVLLLMAAAFFTRRSVPG